ncbi:MAG: hypothetical protein HY343_02780 [Lentisphaerae bacterium]|nr:hypothetical protein [Lentisphaerota bacterium]
MLLLPINTHESVLEPFYDTLLFDETAWALEPGPGVHLEHAAWGYTWYRSWRHAAAGGRVLALRRTYGLALGDFDLLRMLVSWADHLTLTVSAGIDGQSVRLLDRRRGANRFDELNLPLRGLCLDWLELALDSGTDAPGRLDIMSFTLVDTLCEQRWERRCQTFASDWKHCLLAESERPAQPAPALELAFGRDGLDSIRRKVAPGGPYAVFYESLREQARQFKAGLPAPAILDYVRDPRGYWSRPADRAPDAGTPAVLCSFVGLVDQDWAMLEAGAAWAFQLMHTREWTMSWHSRLSAGTWEVRSFHEQITAVSLALAWDWSGSLFSKHATALARKSLLVKALPHAEYDFYTHEYIHGMNQGVLLTAARVFPILAALRQNPRGAGALQRVERELDQVLTRYLLPDGGAQEGPDYWAVTMVHALLMYWVLARHHGQPFARRVPAAVRRGAKYILTNLATAGTGGLHVGVGDSVRCRFTVDLIGLMAALGNPRMQGLLAEALQHPADAQDRWAYCNRGVWALIAGPEALPKPSRAVPGFNVLSDTGMLSSCRPTRHGPVRLFLVGGRAGAGHSHADRGSLILEAFGETLLMERGVMYYDDPRVVLLKGSAFHNLVTPVDEQGLYPDQILPCPSATIPAGHGDRRRLNAEIDIAGAWPAWAKSWRRTLESGQPLVFRLTETVELVRPASLAFHLNSHYPFVGGSNGQWAVAGERGRLVIRPEWTPASVRAEPLGVDRLCRPVQHLALLTAPALTHTLCTVFTLAPNDKSSPHEQTGG